MRAAFRRVGGAIAGALLAASIVSAPAYAEPAALSGTITEAGTGTPLSACVNVYDTDWGWSGGACADELGQWSVDGLESGRAYKVAVSAWDGIHVDEWANDARSFDDASVFTAPAVVDVDLTLGATLEGTLTRADGSPAEWSSVSVSTPDGATDVASSQSSFDGFWRTVVPPGEYVVRFDSWPATQWAFGQTSLEAATRVTAVAGQTLQVDDRLLPGSTVGGTITSDADGSPVEGACVSVLTAPLSEDWMGWAGEACTDVAGTYSVELSTPGTYTVEVTDPSGRFVGEFNGDTRELTDAVAFEVTRGQTTTVDASLALGATITGLAVDAKLGTPIEGACPSAYLGNHGSYTRGQLSECSGTDGRWTVRGLPAGDHAINLATGWHSDHMAGTWAFRADSQATADLVTTTAGATTRIRNVKLVPGGRISGRITDPTGAPVAGAWVDADGTFPGRAGPGEGMYVAQTDEDGRYTIVGLPAGDYRPIVYSGDNYNEFAPEWSGNADSRSAATPVTVKALKTSTFDAEVGPAARLTGTVLDPDGQPAPGTWMGFIYSTDGHHVGDFDYWDGRLTSTALPPGDFVLQLENYETGQVVWYDSAGSAEDATVVSIERGEQREITIHLP